MTGCKKMQNTQKPNSVGEEDVVFLTNAFSPNMISSDKAVIHMIKVTPEQVRRFLSNKRIQSFIGHEATAKALSVLLQTDVPVNRAMLKLSEGELIVFTLNGRLAEGQIISTKEELEKIGYTLWYIYVSQSE